MAHFFKTAWRMIYFWRFLLAGMSLMFTMAVLRVEPGDSGLSFDDAIKAPLFALISAGTLFIGMIPKTPDPNDVIPDIAVRITGATTACLAGWHWLSAETNGNPSQYLYVLAPVFILIVVILVVFPLLSYTTVFFLDGSHSRTTPEDERRRR